MNQSPYYKDTGKIPITSNISFLLRKRMFAKFMINMKPDADHKILDIFKYFTISSTNYLF